jgi:hypothetical protein
VAAPRGPWSIGALLVVRFLLVANAITLAVVGGLFLAFADGRGGLAVGATLVAAAAALLAAVPLTDPYRRERR